MKINLKNHKDIQCTNSVNGIFVFKNKCGVFCDGLNKTLQSLKEAVEFSGKKDEVYTLANITEGSMQKTIFIGLGDSDKFNVDIMRNNTAKLIKETISQKATSIDIHVNQIDSNMDKIVKAMVEAILMSTYKFDKYKSDRKDISLENVNIIFHEEQNIEDLEAAVKEGTFIAEGNLLARYLVNEPANNLTPAELANRAKEVGAACGFEVQIYDRKEIENLEMESFIAVGKGSGNEPKLIVMRYMENLEEKDNILGLVGKGLTFDAGGYCLKSPGNMWEMKSDMGGAGAVIGAMQTIAKMRIKKNIIAVVAACENLISGEAYRPGDILNTMNGKTIEILNTDAEGRLTLVDAVTYIIRRENATKVVDIATLTGAVGRAIGNAATGIVSNDDEFYSKLELASKACDEKVWRFPTFEEYKEILKSGNADLVNSTGAAGGGAITAGLFIGEFVEDKPWIHLDIAATAFSEGKPNREYFSKGATGIGARLLYELAKIY